MRIVVAQYGDGYDGWVRALRRSIHANSSGELVVLRGSCSSSGALERFTHKAQMWADDFQAADERTVYVDADCLVLGDLAGAFDAMDGADVGYTVRPGRWNISGGMLFCRPTVAAARFMGRWVAAHESYLEQPALLTAALLSYPSINEAALADVVRDESCRALPCEVWNSCRTTWHSAESKARMVHAHGKSKRYILGERGPDNDEFHLRHIVEQWREWMEP